MKKIISLMIINIFILLNFSSNSYASYELITNNEKTIITDFVKKYISKTEKNNTKNEVVNKFVKIIKKIDLLDTKFQNKKRILEILGFVKIKLKTYLANLKASELTQEMKDKLKEIKIYKSNLADSIMLENGVEVYKHGNRDLGNENVIYYIRLLDNNLDNIDSDKNEVYIKKAVFIPGKSGVGGKFLKNSNTFVAKLGNFTNSDLYSLKHDFKDVPNCYNPFKEYEGTKYEGIADSMLYVSDNYKELVEKIKKQKRKVTMLNEKGNMCPLNGEVNKMRWLVFDAKQGLIDFLEKDLENSLKKLK